MPSGRIYFITIILQEPKVLQVDKKRMKSPACNLPIIIIIIIIIIITIIIIMITIFRIISIFIIVDMFQAGKLDVYFETEEKIMSKATLVSRSLH